MGHRPALVLGSLVVGSVLTAAQVSASAVALSLVKQDNAGAVRLEWSGGLPDYQVFRSSQPQQIEGTENLLGTTPGTPYPDVPPEGNIWLYSVESDGCDPDGTYRLDQALEYHCTGAFGLGFDLVVDSIRISEGGTRVEALPGPFVLTSVGAPTSCPGGSIYLFSQYDWAIECFQTITLAGTFTDANTLTGTLAVSPMISFPPATCAFGCLPLTATFTARR